METFCILIAALSTVLWVGFALLPWGLWRNREVFEAAPAAADAPLAQITAVIPARNEAELMKLAPGSIRALENQMQQQSTAFISLMAAPSMASRWEKLLMPAFIYFFKALYPFHRVNSSESKMAAAAGG